MTYPLAHFINLPELQLPSEILKVEAFKLSQVNVANDVTVKIPHIILGKQAEFFFSETIKAASNFNILAQNIQINHEKITIGELDYLIKKCENDETIHIELACKFYLLKEDEHIQIEGQWIGPNLKDSLLVKLNKFSKSQFPLLRHAASKDKISSFNISEKIRQQYCIKAMLFVPEGYNIKLPSYYQNCIQGVWKKYGNTSFLPNATYAIPTKREWLLPVYKIDTWYNTNDIKLIVSEHLALKKSPLVYEKIDGKISKFFITWW